MTASLQQACGGTRTVTIIVELPSGQGRMVHWIINAWTPSTKPFCMHTAATTWACHRASRQARRSAYHSWCTGARPADTCMSAWQVHVMSIWRVMTACRRLAMRLMHGHCTCYRYTGVSIKSEIDQVKRQPLVQVAAERISSPGFGGKWGVRSGAEHRKRPVGQILGRAL